MEKFELYRAIIRRAKQKGLLMSDQYVAMMDIENADMKFNLRLEDFLHADDFSFTHDFCGIQDNINRSEFPATDFGLFVPRFVRNKTDIDKIACRNCKYLDVACYGTETNYKDCIYRQYDEINKNIISVIDGGTELEIEIFDKNYAFCGIYINAYIPSEKMYCKYIKGEYRSTGENVLLRMAKDKSFCDENLT